MQNNYSKSGVSVLVCTNNVAEKSRVALKHLANQNVNNDIHWEVIVVSNLHTSNINEFYEIWSSFNVRIPLVVKQVNKKGKELAVDVGLASVAYNYILICDDDNWLNNTYIQRAYEIMINNPTIGLLGGRGVPVFESEPPSWFDQFQGYYATGKQNEKPGEVSTEHDTHMCRYIWGAGSVINGNAYQELVACDFSRMITYSKYPSIARCEDLEICLAIQLAKYKLWYADELVFQHFIPQKRLTWSYLLEASIPGAIARPFLRSYHQFVMDDLNASMYKTYWNKYFFQWVGFHLKWNCRIKNLRNFILFFFSKEQREGNADYLRDVNFLYEFYGLIRYWRHHDRNFQTVKRLKKAIRDGVNVKNSDMKT